MPKLYIELIRQKPYGSFDDREEERSLRNGFLPESRMISQEQAIDVARRAQDAGETIVLVENCDIATEILHDFRARAEVSAKKVESATSVQSGDRILQCVIDCWIPTTSEGKNAVAVLDWRIATVVSEAAITAVLIEENGGSKYYVDDERDQT